MAEVLEVNTAQNQVSTTIGMIPYDYLVIATGSQNNFFNFEPVKDKLLTLKSIPDALNIRSFLFQNLEKALANEGDEPLEEIINVAIIGGNRISINEYNQILGTQNCFAIGDVAAHISEEEPKGLPMLAPVAKQQGQLLAENILNLINQKTVRPFAYKNKGVMATIGRKKAVVDLPHYRFQGGFAWLVWMFIHIFSLVGFRNKAVTFIDWLSNYLSYDRPLGLIIRPYKRTDSK